MSRGGSAEFKAIAWMTHRFARVVGWLILLGMPFIWGKVDWPWRFLVLALATVFFMFRAPAWCGAVTRQGRLCRNNTRGLLMGCHLREHKWQKLRMAVIPRAWSALAKRIWSQNPGQTTGLAIAAITGAATVVSATASVLWHG